MKYFFGQRIAPDLFIRHPLIYAQWPALAQDPVDSRALCTLDDKSQRLSSYILSAR